MTILREVVFNYEIEVIFEVVFDYEIEVIYIIVIFEVVIDCYIEAGFNNFLLQIFVPFGVP